MQAAAFMDHMLHFPMILLPAVVPAIALEPGSKPSMGCAHHVTSLRIEVVQVGHSLPARDGDEQGARRVRNRFVAKCCSR